jgi:glycosyltransferase involved in cell wall biosynthesis
MLVMVWAPKSGGKQVYVLSKLGQYFYLFGFIIMQPMILTTIWVKALHRVPKNWPFDLFFGKRFTPVRYKFYKKLLFSQNRKGVCKVSTNMKRIIMDCDLMKHRNSGLYYYCLNLGHYVQELLEGDPQAQISFYVPPAEQAAFGKPHNHIIEKRDLRNFFKLFLRNCNLWHAPFQSGRILPDKRKYPRTRVLLTIHDLNQLHEGKPLEEQRKSLAHTQSLIDRSDAIVCISEFCRSDVYKNCNVDGKPVYVIHNGIHTVTAPVLTSESVIPKRPFLFGMGYVNRKKNFHVLLPLLKNESLEMIIAGRLDEPDYIESMKKQAVKMGVADRLHITGPITEGEKSWYLQNCYAFMHPSLAEGFGAPVVEAMQFGKPLFLSALTSLPEIGGDVSFYFRDFNPAHMQSVFESGMKCYYEKNMSPLIRENANRFNWKEKAIQYLNVYRTLLNE